MGVKIYPNQHIYFDTNIFVYFLERHFDYAYRVDSLVETIIKNNAKIVTSELTLAEAIIYPLRIKNEKITQLYLNYLQTGSHLILEPITRAILVKSSSIRAQKPLKTPDSIHLATAEETGCSLFITNDKQLAKNTLLEHILLSEIT